MKRREGWPSLLAAAILSARGKPFGYGGAQGAQDCLSFVAECHSAMCGSSPFTEAAGLYTTEYGAAKCLKDRGFDSLESLVSSALPEIAPPFAQRGDVVSFEVDGEIGLGVVLGERAVLVVDPEGVTERPVSQARKAWRIE